MRYSELVETLGRLMNHDLTLDVKGQMVEARARFVESFLIRAQGTPWSVECEGYRAISQNGSRLLLADRDYFEAKDVGIEADRPLKICDGQAYVADPHHRYGVLH